jgi:hypothetical protein
LVGFGCPNLRHAETHSFDGCRRDEVQENLDTTHEVEIVVGLLHGRRIRHAVEEFQCAYHGLDRIRCHNAVRYLVVVTGCVLRKADRANSQQ